MTRGNCPIVACDECGRWMGSNNIAGHARTHGRAVDPRTARSLRRRKPRWDASCPVCGAEFSTTGIKQTCSKTCSKRHDYLKNRTEKLAKVAAYREANREVLAEKSRAYQKSPDGRAAAADRRAVNREKIRSQQRQRYARDPEKFRHASMQWRKDHQDDEAWKAALAAARRRYNDRHRTELVGVSIYGQWIRVGQLPEDLRPVLLAVREARQIIRRKGHTQNG